MSIQFIYKFAKWQSINLNRSKSFKRKLSISKNRKLNAFQASDIHQTI